MDTKRKNNDYDQSSAKRNKPSRNDEEMDEEAILRLVEQAPEIEALNEQQVKKMILNFEKKLTNNQMLRVKFADTPEKFMDSEIELDEVLKEMHILGTAPEFYPIIVRLNTVSSLFSLLAHENADISIDVIELLNELIDSDTLTETKEALVLVDSVLENQGLELLIQNLSRMEEEHAEESRAIYMTFEIVESLVDVRPDISDIITEKTDILQVLLRQIAKSKVPENAQYASELLSIITQSSTKNQKKIGEINGIDSLLVTLARYKKHDPKDATEEEYVENLFDVLCFCLQDNSNCTIFRKLEGIELMLMMVKQKKFARKNALKVLDFALMNNAPNCTHFVEMLGLKTLFAAFMKKGAKKSKKGFDESRDEEHILACIVYLFRHLEGNDKQRLLNKFLENNNEKIERLVELFEKYNNRVSKINRQLEEERKADAEDEDLDDEEREMREEERYLRSLDSGLFTLQLVAQVIAHVCQNGTVKEALNSQLELHGNSFAKVIDIIKDYAAHIGDINDASSNEEPAKEASTTSDSNITDKQNQAAKLKENVLSLVNNLSN